MSLSILHPEDSLVYTVMMPLPKFGRMPVGGCGWTQLEKFGVIAYLTQAIPVIIPKAQNSTSC